jgi:hypothetical protein
MTERNNGHEASADQLDDIGRRIEDVIGEQDAAVAEHVRPHWEVMYDAGHAFAARIVHLHGDRQETTKIIARPDGEAVASCESCSATLQISQAVGTAGDQRAVAPID